MGVFAGGGLCLGNRQTPTGPVQWCYCLDWAWDHSSTIAMGTGGERRSALSVLF